MSKPFIEFQPGDLAVKLNAVRDIDDVLRIPRGAVVTIIDRPGWAEGSEGLVIAEYQGYEIGCFPADLSLLRRKEKE